MDLFDLNSSYNKTRNAFVAQSLPQRFVPRSCLQGYFGQISLNNCPVFNSLKAEHFFSTVKTLFSGVLSNHLQALRGSIKFYVPLEWTPWKEAYTFSLTHFIYLPFWTSTQQTVLILNKPSKQTFILN